MGYAILYVCVGVVASRIAKHANEYSCFDGWSYPRAVMWIGFWPLMLLAKLAGADS